MFLVENIVGLMYLLSQVYVNDREYILVADMKTKYATPGKPGQTPTNTVVNRRDAI